MELLVNTQVNSDKNMNVDYRLNKTIIYYIEIIMWLELHTEWVYTYVNT